VRRLGPVIVVAVLVAACGGAPAAVVATPSATASAPATPETTAVPTVAPTRTPAPTAAPIADVIGRISADKMWDHLNALTAVSSRDPRHPGHAKAQAYIVEQLEALSYLGVKVETQRFTYQAIPLMNILAIVDPPGGAPPRGGVIVGAHYDSIGKASPGWRPNLDPAPGADDDGTGTAALLEYARVIANDRATLTHRVVIAFWDGEEFFFKGAAAFVQALEKPFAYSAFVNIDMVGFNPITDRLDLFWYGAESDTLRDRAIAANATYQIGVSPLRPVFADDPSTVIMDSAPFGLSGIPAITVAEGYLDPDATYPGNSFFHTVNDTPDKVNKRLWLKASKLCLAVTMELARAQ
jgi:peptidase M28-like protein